LNNFAAAAFISRLYPNYKWIVFIIASLIAFSRVYLGVHYPFDIVGGAIIGMLFGYLFTFFALPIEKSLVSKKAKRKK
jgi:undecaprenyl-diphosphatase